MTKRSKIIQAVQLISIILLLSLFMSCKTQKVITERSFVEKNPISVAPKKFNLSLDSASKFKPIFISAFDTVVKDSIRISYVWDYKTNTVTTEVDCPDYEETIVTLERELDLSEKSKSKIEDRAEKRADKEIDKARDEWIKYGKREGVKKGRNQAIGIFILLLTLYLLGRFKFKLPI